MVNVKDLPSNQKRRAEKLFNHGKKYDDWGVIKFSHNQLNATSPTFESYLDLKEAERKVKKPGLTVQTYEYISSKKETSKRKKKDEGKKKSGFTWPWSRR
jgi:hypothetical protein